ncbi:MAG: YiiX family permuted papain-like enzyme [Cytophagaceae bacterium]|nr:MAG: YiiX family permuted papain-like enzyme [Cytophagaceae bacterium]
MWFSYWRQPALRWAALLLLGGSLLAFAYPRLRPRLGRWQQLRRATATARALAPTLREGDLIFQTSPSAQSRAIQLATHSPYSHCGLLLRQPGGWQVLEAVQPVRLTPLARWVARGRGGHFVVKRLRDADQMLTLSALHRLRAAGQLLLGRPYDVAFGWSDERLYCSELLWKIYDRGLHRQLGSLQRLGDFDLRHPAVQAKLRERYGPHPPLEEPVISPVAVFASPELRTVAVR